MAKKKQARKHLVKKQEAFEMETVERSPEEKAYRRKTLLFVLLGVALLGVLGAMLTLFVAPALQDFSHPGLLRAAIPYLFVAYIAGILSFLAPCTLPLIPAYLSLCMKRSFHSLTVHTIYLGIGLAIVFVSMGVFAGTLGAFIALHRTLFIAVSGSLLILVGVLTLFNVPMLHFHPEQKRFTPLSTIAYGALVGFAWAGCIGPVLGGILVLAGTTGTTFTGGFLLLVYAAGLLTPLLMISIITDRTKRVPHVWKGLSNRGVSFKIAGRTWSCTIVNCITGLLFILLGIFFLSGGTEWLAQNFTNQTDYIFTMESNIQAWLGVR